VKITILTYGSSGDVLPYIALALGLQDSGHVVTLTAPSNFEKDIIGKGLIYRPIHGDVQQILKSDDGRAWMASQDYKEFNKTLFQLSGKHSAQMQRDLIDACRGTEAIIGGSMLLLYAAMISEKLKVPLLAANVNPVLVMTGVFPHFLVAARPKFFIWNGLTYLWMAMSYEKNLKPIMDDLRAELGLAPFKGWGFLKMIRLKLPVVLGYSPALLPKPWDWSALVHVSGQWLLNEKYKKVHKPDGDLVNWLKAGPPPIYFGFGSMPVTDPLAMVNMVKAICSEMDSRAIINAGWSDIEITGNTLTNPVYIMAYSDLEWLFPQCRSIVHHGGVGTTHLSLAAGVPTVICSVFADNAFWGERLQKLNIGRHIPYKDISQEAIINAISELEKDEPRRLAREMADEMNAINGVQRAVDFINKHLPTARPYAD
jgi:sterol 3beta-glucosyltransferase